MREFEKFAYWKDNAAEQDMTQALLEMEKDENRKRYAFLSPLSFGTAGLRGIMDAGINCMNVYTVVQATKGLADYLLKENKEGEISAVISFDSRHNSLRFAQAASSVFANCGIKVYLTQDLKPTPYLSFAVRQLKANCGIMITASHNGKEYNGYKVYNNKGIQINEGQALELAAIIRDTNPFKVEYTNFENLLNLGRVEYIKKEITTKYLQAVESQGKESAQGLNIVYSPLNGCGYALVPRVLRKKGAKVSLVPTQSFPSGDFTTCPNPNPEREDALKEGTRILVKKNYDIFLSTDPDCDRVGVVVLKENIPHRLSGNETGVLLLDYLLQIRKRNNTLPKTPIVIKTIVTTNLVNKIADDYGAITIDLLTGFKYIGEYVDRLSQSGKEQDFILGFEESCGYLTGNYCGDKDGVLACMLVAQMAAYYKNKGLTLIDRLQTLYRKYKRHAAHLLTLRFSGAEGEEKRVAAMQKLRQSKIVSISELKVLKSEDLSKEGGELPKSDVLIYTLEKDVKIIARPSGTEPLIKFYMFACGEVKKTDALFEEMGVCFKNFLAQ